MVNEVASVKVDVIDSLGRPCLEAGCAFVGGHPVTGSEEAGARAANAMLFRDHRCVLTPTAATDPRALARVREFWTRLGMIVEQMDAAAHDAILARVSHLPHLVAYALAAAVGDAVAAGRPVAEYAGPGFRDTTRIAASPARLWSEICLANRGEILRALEEFSRRPEELDGLIRREDGAGLERALGEASSQRRGLGAVRRPR